MKSTHDQGRKSRILDAAELSFAAAGFDAASLRRIVTEARVNLATVYYYFGSKEGLVIAVVKRRFDPLRDQNLALLDEAMRKTSPKAPAVEDILHAMLQPVLELAQAGSQESQILLGLIGRMWTEPSETIQQLLQEEFAEVRARFLKAFREACPHLRTPDLLWRTETARAAICAMLCNIQKIRDATGGVCDPGNVSAVLSHLIPFFAAGFRAPTIRTRIPGGRRSK